MAKFCQIWSRWPGPTLLAWSKPIHFNSLICFWKSKHYDVIGELNQSKTFHKIQATARACCDTFKRIHCWTAQLIDSDKKAFNRQTKNVQIWMEWKLLIAETILEFRLTSVLIQRLYSTILDYLSILRCRSMPMFSISWSRSRRSWRLQPEKSWKFSWKSCPRLSR